MFPQQNDLDWLLRTEWGCILKEAFDKWNYHIQSYPWLENPGGIESTWDTGSTDCENKVLYHGQCYMLLLSFWVILFAISLHGIKFSIKDHSVSEFEKIICFPKMFLDAGINFLLFPFPPVNLWIKTFYCKSTT